MNSPLEAECSEIMKSSVGVTQSLPILLVLLVLLANNKTKAKIGG